MTKIPDVLVSSPSAPFKQHCSSYSYLKFIGHSVRQTNIQFACASHRQQPYLELTVKNTVVTSSLLHCFDSMHVQLRNTCVVSLHSCVQGQHHLVPGKVVSQVAGGSEPPDVIPLCHLCLS